MGRSHSIQRPRIAGASAVLLTLGAVLTVTSAANAGLGDLMKKAKEKATQVVAPKDPAAPAAQAGNGKVVFDDVTLELTEERLDKMLAAFQASCEIRAPRAGLVEKLNKVNNDRGALDEKYGEAMRESRNKREEKEQCYGDGYRKAQEQKALDYKQRALTDPALRQKFADAAAKYNADAARGDSTAQAKLNAVLMGEMMPSKEDSAAARKSCGPLPPFHPAQAQMDNLDKQLESLNNQIRDIDEKVGKMQAEKGGLNGQQWAAALERLRSIVPSTDSNGGGGGRKNKDGGGGKNKDAGIQTPKGFTPGEAEAIEKRQSQLRSLLSDQC